MAESEINLLSYKPVQNRYAITLYQEIGFSSIKSMTLIKKLIIIDYSQQNLLSIFNTFRYNWSIFIDFNQILSIIHKIAWLSWE